MSIASERPRYDLPPEIRPGREESWLRSGQRVLELAEDAAVPLLERVRFLATFASNLDEFFSVHVAGLARRLHAELETEATGPPRPELERIFDAAGALMLRHAVCFRDAVLPALAGRGIEFMRWQQLPAAQRRGLHRLFRDRIYPVVTPLLVDPAHPFPYISGLSLNLAVVAANPSVPEKIFARVEVPPLLPRFLAVSPRQFFPLEDLIVTHLGELFEGTVMLEHHAFRVTRDQDPETGEDIAASPVQSLRREPPGRWKGLAVRLEAEDSISDGVLTRLATELGISERAIYRLPGPLDLAGLHAIADLDLPDLKYPAAKGDRVCPV